MDRLFLVFCISACFLYNHAGAQGVGINYGLLGNNLPPPDTVIRLLNSKNIKTVRIFEPDPNVLRALGNSGIEVVLGTLNEDLQQLAENPAFATQWVNTNVIPYVPAVKIRYISAGNEVILGPLAQFVAGAIQNLDIALKASNVSVPVSTAIQFDAIGQSFPPSSGAFKNDAVGAITPVVAFLVSKQYPILANVYPYFAYASDTVNIRLDYALGTASGPVVTDGPLLYSNLFDAMVDALYAALEKVGGPALRIVVSETGWPSAGNGDVAVVPNAQVYVNNVLAHVKSAVGTPRRPGIPIETHIFALFNENLKPAGVEQNFGLYYPNMTEVYAVTF
ncbi:putative glucan endo-1,3-beta-glucosidase GVI [Hevea brasiliensis]|uniref:putative glucan endo-1,3-beta-glucosidase GVI n=1 Tax=Hevea brasiliensis TaxID=3981 RepID=UPI0025DEF81F|nr:putative glucan endo-1,3-beta-glucosidase GVI [Hevea brasiliensis]